MAFHQDKGAQSGPINIDFSTIVLSITIFFLPIAAFKNVWLRQSRQSAKRTIIKTFLHLYTTPTHDQILSIPQWCIFFHQAPVGCTNPCTTRSKILGNRHFHHLHHLSSWEFTSLISCEKLHSHVPTEKCVFSLLWHKRISSRLPVLSLQTMLCQVWDGHS